MKKVSAKLFFTVLWRGLCQAVGWFFGLFGYKKEGKFYKYVWRLFAISAALIMALIAVIATMDTWDSYKRRTHSCQSPYCWENTRVNGEIYYHSGRDAKGYIYNLRTGEKLLKNVAWIAKPLGRDSLVCFSNGKKRGYFNKNTGKVVIKPQYDHAWIFSDGLASVEVDGYIKFIDVKGQVVIDKNMAYDPSHDGYVFHHNYCIVGNNDDEYYGLLDKSGNWALPMEYNDIEPQYAYDLWEVHKDGQEGVFDCKMQPVFPLMDCEVYIGDETIDVTMPDHTMCKYDLGGNLINDFYIYEFRTLEYEKSEIIYKTVTHDDDGDEYATPQVVVYQPRAIARLRAYQAGDGYEGLMTADGHVVMMPLYHDIEAIDHDLYLCTSTNYDKVIVNGKGEIVK